MGIEECPTQPWSPHDLTDWVLAQNSDGSARLFFRYCRRCLYVEEREPPMAVRVRVTEV